MKFSKECLKEGQKLLIYGASVYGELALRGLEPLGLTPFCFVDRASHGGEYLGYPVIKPESLTDYRNDCILIASADFYYEIFNFLEGTECNYIYDISELLTNDINYDVLSSRAKEMHNAKGNYIKATEATDLTIIHLGFCVSERCTLKCRDCSFLMQYYTHPENIDLEKYKSAMDRLVNVVDYIAELRLYGGEPFVNKEMYKMIEWYGNCKKINTISVYTNGTIIPDKATMECLKNNKVKVHISDYKHNRLKVNALTDVLKENGVSYFIREYDLWQQSGDLKRRNYSKEKAEDLYSKCFATNCYSFLKGKFYACPRAAHSVNLRVLEDNENDFVDFNSTEITDNELQERLKDLMHNRKYLEACFYCDGLDNHIEGVTPAIQTDKPLPINQEK